MSGWLQAREDGVVLHLVVQPRASKNEIVGAQGEELKIRLTSPPVEGAANKLCCEFFAGMFDVPNRAVTLESGDRSRHKRLRIEGVTLDTAERLLNKALGK